MSFSDASLHIETAGAASASAPALYCLHGIGGCAQWFKGLGERLRADHRTMTLDLPGTGRNRRASGPLQAYSIEGAARALAAHLRAHESQPVTLLGHSMGVMVSLHLQALVPERIKAFVFVGGLPKVRPLIFDRLSERRALIVKQGMAGLGWKAAEGVFSPVSVAERPEVMALFARMWEDYDANAYVEGINALLAADTWDLARSARLPTWVITGRDDAYAPPAETQAFVQQLPGLKRHFELPDCGHMAFLEDPSAFHAAVRACLDEASKASR